MRDLVYGFQFGTIALAAILTLIAVADGLAPRAPLACPTEDANNGELANALDGPCLWDAEVRGNGLGVSFLVFPDGRTVVINELNGEQK